MQACVTRSYLQTTDLKEITMSFATLAVTVLLAAAPSGASQQAGSNQHASPAQPGWGETRRDNPHSTVVEDDSRPVHYPTDDEINAAELGNPESTDFRYSNLAGGPVSQADLDALEAGNPHSVRPPEHAAVAVASTANEKIRARGTRNLGSTEVRYATAVGFGSEPGFLAVAENPHVAQPSEHAAATTTGGVGSEPVFLADAENPRATQLSEHTRAAVPSAAPAPTCLCMSSHGSGGVHR